MDFGNVACKTCGEICVSPFTHQTHVVGAHGGKPTVCHICLTLFRSVTTLKTHLNVHLRNKVGQRKFCNLCEEFMPSFLALKSHYKAHHPYFMDTHKGVACPFCLKLCTIQEYELHAQKHRAEGLVHPVSTVEHCQVCWKKFITPVAMVAHCRAVHRLEIGQQPALEIGAVFCSFCDEVFSSVPDLKEHWFTHLPEGLNPLKCDLCPLSFNKFQSLRRHVEAVHPAQYRDKPWCYCGDCGTAFYAKEYLDVHWDSKDCDPITEGTIRALMHPSPITAPPKEIITLESDSKFSDVDVIAADAIAAIEEILSDETVVLSDTSSALADLERVLDSDCESGDINPGFQPGGELEDSILKESESFLSLDIEAELSPSGMIVLDEWNLADEEEVKPINESVLANQVDECSVEVALEPKTETGTTLPDLSLVLCSADEEYKVPLPEFFPEQSFDLAHEDLNIPAILDAFSVSTEEFISAPDESVSVGCLLPFPDSGDFSENLSGNSTEVPNLLNGSKRQAEDESDSQPAPKRRKPRRGREFVRCLKCPSTYSAYKELTKHSWSHYFPPSLTRCNYSNCSYVAKSTVALYQHSVDCHVVLLPKDFTYQKCKYCFDEFLSLTAFEQHAELHKGSDYVSVGSDPLKKTMQVKSQSSYRCNICLQGYSLKASYLKHIRFCKDAYNRCEECNKAFPTASKLRAHSLRCAGKVLIPEASHTYVCYCGATFKTERRFQEHSDKVHVSFKCGQCGKSFPTKRLLESHLQVHIDKM